MLSTTYGFQDPLTHAVRFIIYLEAVTLATCRKSRKKIRQMPIVLVSMEHDNIIHKPDVGNEKAEFSLSPRITAN